MKNNTDIENEIEIILDHMKQIEEYKKIADIYERTQIALGRRFIYKTFNEATNKVKLNFSKIGAATTTAKNLQIKSTL